MEGTLTIVGVTNFNGTVEGRQYNTTKCIVLLPFSSNKKEAKIGFDALYANYGTHENFKKFEGRKFPLNCECEWENTTDGLDIISVKFSNLANQAPKP